jgi:hypothetical protein
MRYAARRVPRAVLLEAWDGDPNTLERRSLEIRRRAPRLGWVCMRQDKIAHHRHPDHSPEADQTAKKGRTQVDSSPASCLLMHL